MGPKSKDAVCETLGHILDELQQIRSALSTLRGAVEHAEENFAEDFTNINRRVLGLELGRSAQVVGKQEIPHG